MTKLFLDDERMPIGNDWHIVRNFEQFKTYIKALGCPSFISFDHDLGEEHDGYACAKWLVEHNYIPQDFQFYVHSQNPIGKKNIECLLNNYLRVLKCNHINIKT